jgi:hypothetical protein
VVKLGGKNSKIILGILVFCLIWAAFAFAIHTALQNNTLGADFATFWIGSRTVLLEGKTPYSPEVTALSQQIIYQRPALPEEDQLAFAYPLPSVYLLFPVVWMSLDWAQAFWMGLNILALLTALFFLFPGTPGPLRFSFFLFYPIFFGLVLGNFAILVSVFILIFLQLIFNAKNRPAPPYQILSAILLAICIIKPQFAWAYLLLAVLISIRSHLWPFLTAFCATALVLILSSLFIVPTWPFQWLKRVTEYTRYVKGQPTLAIYLRHLFPESWITPLAAIVILIVGGISLWLIFKWWKNQLSALLLLTWGGFVTYLVHPHGISYEQITFILPFLLWAASYRKVNKMVVLTWIAAIVLSWALFFITFFKLIPVAVNEFPFLFYIVWMIWLFYSTGNNSLKKTDLKI